MDNQQTNIFIVSAEDENVRIRIPRTVLPGIKTIQDMLDDISVSDNEPSSIPVPRVLDQKSLDLVLEYMNYDAENPISEELKTGQKVQFSKWETEFFSRLESLTEQPYLFQLISITNYLNYNRLFHTSCYKVASMIEGKTPDQIRETFGLPDDLTEEEKEKLYIESGLRPAFSKAAT